MFIFANTRCWNRPVPQSTKNPFVWGKTLQSLLGYMKTKHCCVDRRPWILCFRGHCIRISCVLLGGHDSFQADVQFHVQKSVNKLIFIAIKCRVAFLGWVVSGWVAPFPCCFSESHFRVALLSRIAELHCWVAFSSRITESHFWITFLSRITESYCWVALLSRIADFYVLWIRIAFELSRIDS